MKKGNKKTPVRSALLNTSTLLPLVDDGLGAVKNAHRDYFDAAIRQTFADSLDLDAAMRSDHAQANRWDYLLGHTPSGSVVAVEPHSAKHDEITTVINKRLAALKQMKGHLREGARVTKWIWVASGKNHFANTEKAILRLSQKGIKFVSRKVTAKDLS